MNRAIRRLHARFRAALDNDPYGAEPRRAAVALLRLNAHSGHRQYWVVNNLPVGTRYRPAGFWGERQGVQ